MYILRHLTKQLRTRLALRSFNVHRLGSSINYVCGRLHQEPDFSVLDTENGLCSKYIWSRSYTSQVSTNFKVVLERLKDRNVPQVEEALESADFKKHILDLVSYYYDFENQTGQKAVETSMSIVDLYQIHVIRRYYGFVPQVGEHLSKSDSFKKLLETLPDHVDNISIGDQLDIYMGLLLLGVEETNLSMNQLFCNFYKTDSMLGLSELAKMRLLLFHKHHYSKAIFRFMYTPDIQYLLKTNCIQNQEDCKSLALLIEGENYIGEIFFKICNQMLFYTAHSNPNDIDFILKILNAFFSSSLKLSENKRVNRLLPLLKKIMNRLEPQIEKLTSSKIVAFLSELRTGPLVFLHVNYSRIFKDMCSRVVFSLEGVLSGDLPLEEKVDYLYATTKLYSINPHIFTSEMINKMLQFITESIPNAKFPTIYVFVKILLKFQTNQQTGYVLNFLITRTLEILQSQPTFCVQIDGISILKCFNYLFGIRPWTFNKLYYEFKPYIKWYIESGHVCSSLDFSKSCKFAIPILGNNMSVIADKRLRNQILLIAHNEHKDQIYWHFILEGALLEYANKKSDYADSIIRLLTTTLQRRRLDTYYVCEILQKIQFGFIHSASISDLKKAIADQVVVDQNFLGQKFASKSLLHLISEKNANTLLRYSAMAYFNGKYMGDDLSKVLFNLIKMFFHMSRYPKDKQLLEDFSKSIFDKYFYNLPIYESFKILYILCSLDIYLDQYLQMVFSQEYLAKMDDYVVGQTNNRKRNQYVVVQNLNRAVVLHRQKLKIPWISNPIVNLGYRSTYEMLLQETVKFDHVKMHLNEVLGGSAFLTTHVTAEYGIHIDFEFFLNSSNKPMDYKKAKQIHHSESDIQKIAVIIGRKTQSEYLAEDPTAASVYNTNMIKDLNALGYKAVLIQGHEWNSLMPEGRNHFLKEKIFEKEMK